MPSYNLVYVKELLGEVTDAFNVLVISAKDFVEAAEIAMQKCPENCHLIGIEEINPENCRLIGIEEINEAK